MATIQFPMLYIPDPIIGRPLFNAKIYVGQPDLDPTVVGNQKQLRVVLEDGTKVDVPQPFSTSAGGVPVYFGKTVELDVDGNYSLKILSNTNVQKYYDSNVFEGTPITESSLISNLSQAYECTVAEYKALTSLFPVGKTVYLTDRDANFKVIAGNTATSDYDVVFSAQVNQSVQIIKQDVMTLKSLGVVNEVSFISALNYSGVNEIELIGKVAFTQTSRIDLPSKFNLKSNKGDIVLTASATYFSGAEFAMVYGAAVTAITDSNLEGVTCIGGLSDYTNDGVDKHGILIYGCTDTSVRNCIAKTLERGIIIRDGASGGESCFNDAIDCYNQGVGYIGTSGSPIQNVSLHNNSAKTVGFTTQAKMSGIRTEEVYDSDIYQNKATKCDIGIRLENSCDNNVWGNYGWENDKCGGELYNLSQRNTVTNNHFFDNNVSNQNSTSLTPDNKGNADTKFSGFNVENNSNNNIITGNYCYQTIGGIGHQKYGIGINVRNLIGGGAADAYNTVKNNQCFNNEIGQVEDRGIANDVSDNMEFYYDIIRSV